MLICPSAHKLGKRSSKQEKRPLDSNQHGLITCESKPEMYRKSVTDYFFLFGEKYMCPLNGCRECRDKHKLCLLKSYVVGGGRPTQSSVFPLGTYALCV